MSQCILLASMHAPVKLMDPALLYNGRIFPPSFSQLLQGVTQEGSPPLLKFLQPRMLPSQLLHCTA